MDFNDYTNPFKNIFKIIHSEVIYDEAESKNLIASKQYKIKQQYLEFNEAKLSDNPIINPWDDSAGQAYEYLTVIDS